MKSIKNVFSIYLIAFVLLSCNSKPSLQKYYVENQENQNFMVVDIPTSILNVTSDSLTNTQQKAYNSIKKLTFLGFKKTKSNGATYKTERRKVTQILEDDDYKTLITYGAKNQGAIVKYLGEDTAIEEVVLFFADNTQGFGVVRIMGDDMNPAQIHDFIEVVKKSNPNKNALKDIANFF